MKGLYFPESGDSAVTIETVYDIIRKMKPSKKSEQYVRQYLFPLLTTKFQSLDNFAGGTGYAVENELLVSEKNSLIKQIRKMVEKYDKLQKEKGKLQSDLAARITHCDRQCRYSREQYIKEQKNFLDSMLEDSEDMELCSRALKSAAVFSGKSNRHHKYSVLSDLNILLRQKNSLKKEFRGKLETFIDAACNPVAFDNDKKYSPEALEDNGLALFAMETCILMLNRIASETAYKFLSTLDYCLQLKHNPEELAVRLSKFKRVICKSDIYTNDLNNRIEDYSRSLLTCGEGETN